MMQRRRIAIFHNFLDNIGGAELVDLLLARELGADIYTTNIDFDKIRRMGFSTENIFSIGSIPIHAPFKQELAYWKFRLLNLGSRYDFYIIAGDWAMGAGVHHKPHLWYVYSPIREIWDLYRDTRSRVVPWALRWIFDVWVHYRRVLNRCDVRSIGAIVSISQTVQRRVNRYLGRESKVIYPPVDISKYHYEKNGDFWLSVNRLVGYKRIEMQFEAFRRLPNERLVIVGSYEQAFHFKKYARKIKALKPDNVTMVSWADDNEVVNLYATCKGFITTSRQEDFGLTPVEAMASGKPVIAPNEGGYQETVLDGVTGHLINDINVDKIVSAIQQIGRDPARFRNACEQQARIFSKDRFIDQIKTEIETLIHRKESSG